MEGRFHIKGAFSQPISQLRNEGGGLRNGTRVPRGGFAAAKIFAEGVMRLQNHFAAKGLFRSGGLISQQLPWGCKNWSFKALGISRPISQLRNEVGGCEMALVCQRSVSQRGALFRSQGPFSQGLFLAAKFRRPLNFHAFELLLDP